MQGRSADSPEVGDPGQPGHKPRTPTSRARLDSAVLLAYLSIQQ
jgi:hypothetical protein